MRDSLCLYIILLLSDTRGIYSYIYDVLVMRRWNAISRQYTYVIGCSDYHSRQSVVVDTQRICINSILKKSSKDDLLVLIEDLSSSAPSDSYSQAYPMYPSRGILAQLAVDCRIMGLDVVNVEYRYHRVNALKGVLKNPLRSPFYCQDACATRVASLIDEIEKTLEEINSYSDGFLLRLLYDRECIKVRSLLASLRFSYEKDRSVAYFCNQYTSWFNRFAWVKRMLTFDSSLLDCKLVHHIVTASPDKKNLLLLAGGTHINHVSLMLKQIGFELIDTFCEKLALIDSGNIQPGPVSVDILQQYI